VRSVRTDQSLRARGCLGLDGSADIAGRKPSRSEHRQREVGKVLAPPSTCLSDLSDRRADFGEGRIELERLEDRRAEAARRVDDARPRDQGLADEASEGSPNKGVDMA
jgi:hypothetical protein